VLHRQRLLPHLYARASARPVHAESKGGSGFIATSVTLNLPTDLGTTQGAALVRFYAFAALVGMLLERESLVERVRKGNFDSGRSLSLGCTGVVLGLLDIRASRR